MLRFSNIIKGTFLHAEEDSGNLYKVINKGILVSVRTAVTHNCTKIVLIEL